MIRFNIEIYEKKEMFSNTYEGKRVTKFEPIVVKSLQSAALIICYWYTQGEMDLDDIDYKKVEQKLYNAVNARRLYETFPIEDCNYYIECNMVYYISPIMRYSYIHPTGEFLTNSYSDKYSTINLLYNYIDDYLEQNDDDRLFPAVPRKVIKPAIESCVDDAIERKLSFIYFLVDNQFALICHIDYYPSMRFTVDYSKGSPSIAVSRSELCDFIKKGNKNISDEEIINAIRTAIKNNEPYVEINNHDGITQYNIIRDNVAELHYFPILATR